LNNSKEELILSALLSCPTIREASAKCKVPERTITDYLAKPEFMERYKEAKADIVRGVSDKMQGKMSQAVDVIGELMEQKRTPPAVRLSASKTVLEIGLKFQENEQIIERIERLEDAIEKSKK
jgi:hypothetical protein